MPKRQVSMSRPQNSAEIDSLSLVAFNRAMAEHAEGLKTYAARMLSDSILAEELPAGLRRQPRAADVDTLFGRLL